MVIRILGFLFLTALPLMAATYTGSLTYTPPGPATSSDGLAVGPSNLQWITYTIGIFWTVTDTDNTYATHPWKYTYTFGHDGSQAGISHVIIETSPTFNASSMVGLTGASFSALGLQFSNGGNPNMPEYIYGLKVDPLTSPEMSMTFSFYSDRAPVWGDFYARCGGKLGGINYAYNYNNTDGVENGFLNPDAITTNIDDIDPLAAATNGSLNFHILRPDSVVPEPATLSLMSLAGVALLRRRKSA